MDARILLNRACAPSPPAGCATAHKPAAHPRRPEPVNPRAVRARPRLDAAKLVVGEARMITVIKDCSVLLDYVALATAHSQCR